jgi:hypothetical protein
MKIAYLPSFLVTTLLMDIHSGRFGAVTPPDGCPNNLSSTCSSFSVYLFLRKGEGKTGKSTHSLPFA